MRRHDPSSLAFALGALAVTACIAACAGSRGALVQAPVDLTIAPISSLPDAGIATNGESATGQCSLRLVAARIEKSSPGCVLDEHLSRTAGLLYYPCNGDGAVEAQFGEQRYTGRMAGGEVELELQTELDWEDGCRWGTHAVISGPIPANGGAASKRLSWRYRDRVLTGKDCSGACTAKTTIEVTSAKGRAPALPSAHESDEDEDDPD